MESVHRYGARERNLALPLVLPLIAAVLFGSLIVFAEVNAAAVSIALLACIFIMLDFRFGVVCLIVFMPLSASSMLPHNIGGITGLNPLNLLLVGTLVSWALQRLPRGTAPTPAPPQSLLWLYVLPFLVASVLGFQHLGDIAARLLVQAPISFSSPTNYVLSIMIKPLFMVLFALLVAAAAARSRQPEKWIIPMLVSVWAMCLMTIGFAAVSGASLTDLSSSESRRLLSPLGLHANDLGRLFAIVYALMLYTFAATQDTRLRMALIASMGLVVVALTLTFSRGAFFGFAVVNLLFLLSRRTPSAFLLSGLVLLAFILMLPAAVFERIGTGWGSGLNAISSGRIEEIWLPLLPEVLRHPIFGNGLGAIAWSAPMHAGTMQAVSHAHNAYLNAALDMGLLGLILLCAYFLHVWRGFRRLSIDPAITPTLRGFYAGAAAGLVSFLLAGFFGSSLTPRPEQFFLWLAIGMMYGQRLTSRTTKEPAPC
ncbi:MAG: O-antigen ligase family protein [Rhodocyclaceae bacterium]|nr:O-antigen ligase family protein [Rhodocyclaceae bacterium]MDZ4213979.1 O-antigen ligase family protein [Rhodocyclaceae bacterium]